MRARTIVTVVFVLHLGYLLHMLLGMTELENSKGHAEAQEAPVAGDMKSGVCYIVQGHHCARSVWTPGENNTVRIKTGAPLRLKVVPGLWGEGTVSLLECTSSMAQRYLGSRDGCELSLRPIPKKGAEWFKRSASFHRHVNSYYDGFFSLEASDHVGRFISQREGFISLEPEDSRQNFRADSSWAFLPAPSSGVIAETTMPSAVHVLNDPLEEGVTVPQYFDESEECSREHKGCCSATETDFITPTVNELGPFRGYEVTVMVISSLRTIAARKGLLKRWLFDRIRKNLGPWKRAVISLDCYTSEVDTSYPNTDWLVGPAASGALGGVNQIAVRVNLALHWTFKTHRDTAFYFMVDDDTLVFSNHVIWALTHLNDPYNKIWYVGGGSEWKIKQFFHGNMAFGGGGVLISNHAGRTWISRFPGTPENATREWLMKGICSHEGGDGAFCRCLRHAAGRPDIFTPFLGFHQFDVVGTAALLDDIKDTCPDCPSLYEQTGVWIDDIIGRSTVLTFHHILAIDKGAVYPGLSGMQTGLLLMEAYDTHPPFLLARRVCGRSVNNTYTLCVNFGHRLQIFRSDIRPEDALVLLQTSDGTSSLRPRMRLISLSIRAHVQEAQMCSMTYSGAMANMTGAANKYVFRYTGSRIEPRPAHDGGCLGHATMKIVGHQMSVHINYKELNDFIEWKQGLAEILPLNTPT